MARRGAILQDYGNIQNPPSDNSLTIENNRLAESRRQHDDEMRQRRDLTKQKQAGDSTKFITELKNEKTGINDIDIENDKQLLAAQNRMIEMQQKGAPLSEIQIYAMRELPKINNAYTLGKNYKEQVTKGMTDLEKKYGNGVDLNAVQSEAYKKMADDIFDRDDKGNIIGYKDPNLIPKNKDYIAEIENDSKSLGTIFKPSGAFETGVQKTDLIPIKDKFTKTDKYGNKTKYNYTGFGTIYDEPILNEQGEQTGWDVKGEVVPLGKNPDGTVILERVMPKEQFEIATGSAAAKKDFDIKFHNYLNESGTNPDQLDARAKDILERKFAYDLFKKTNIHGSSFLSEEEVKAAPIKNITNINNRTGSEVNVNDLYGKIDAISTEKRDNGIDYTAINNLPLDAQTVVLDFANKGKQDDEILDRSEIFVKKETNGDVNIYKVAGIKKDGTQDIRFEDAFRIGTLPKVGTNLKVQANTKAKAEVVKQGEANKTSKPIKKEINRSDIPAKASAAGYSVKEYEALLKQKGVTIKD